LLYQVVNAIPNQIMLIIDHSTFKFWTICSIYWSLLILRWISDSLRAIWQLDHQLRLSFWVTISFPNLWLISINRFLSWESSLIPSQLIFCSNPRT
jgi:fucose 4-O-acetylase-like acetyltransferase